MRFVSAEPLLGPIDLSHLLGPAGWESRSGRGSILRDADRGHAID
jgi:hypothetical protein